MARIRRSNAACAGLLAALLAAAAAAQAPAPGAETSPGRTWHEHGRERLAAEDPVAAWQAFRRASIDGGLPVECRLGLGRVHLMLGSASFALAYAEAALGLDPGSQESMALCVRALIRARLFEDAVRRAEAFSLRTQPLADLLAARASALFRVQRIADAARDYRDVVTLEPLHAEAHLRLGSGLLGPTEVRVTRTLQAAVDAAVAGDHERAITILQGVLASEPLHPVAHRLLGEVIFARRTAASMAAEDPAFRALAAAVPPPPVHGVPVGDFIVGYERLSPARRAVVDRTAALFARHVTRLVTVGGRHDLLTELERTTDASGRASLRGRRTFDGRVWDDVRGVGGMQAATGIEALDEAATFGFDTLAHEVAHQVHFFSLDRVQRARIRSLYQRATAEGRCLDYYAATNEAEYFGQGVEAFVSLGKRPGGETTHGHTRFELRRVDPALHDFIASVVEYDPLRVPDARDKVLEAAFAVALRCGRFEDAEVAAAMVSAGPLRDRLVADAARAAAAARCH